jgi:hypothetical protein
VAPRTIATLTTVALVAIGLTTSASGSSTRTKVITIRTKSKLEHAAAVDNAPTGDSPGDRLVFTEKLLDSRGRIIGHDAADCVRLFDARSLCTGTYILPEGQLMVQLLQPKFTGTLTYTQAIIGGTGRYAAARGTVTLHQAPSGDHSTFKIVVGS